jgi:lipid-binding SYLF domain-containing protein
MPHPQTDTELLEATWRMYTSEFADTVGAVVTPDEQAETDAHLEWTAQVFMFGYALGSIAGASVTGSAPIDRETDQSRVDAIVETVTDITAGDDVGVSTSTVVNDFEE